jgi:hypothetical protein
MESVIAYDRAGTRGTAPTLELRAFGRCFDPAEIEYQETGHETSLRSHASPKEFACFIGNQGPPSVAARLAQDQLSALEALDRMFDLIA